MLVVLGLVGYLCFALLIAPLHPDSTAEYVLTDREAIEIADTFLRGNGFDSDNLIVTARLQRDVDALTDIQHMLGRREAVKFLGSPVSEPMAAYHWRIRFAETEADDDNSSRFAASSPVFTIRLSQSGNVLGFETEDRSRDAAAGAASSRGVIVRQAVAHALSSESVPADSVQPLLGTVPDSTLRNRLFFDYGYGGVSRGVSALQSSDDVVRIDSAGMVALARYHLSRTALSTLSWSLTPSQASRPEGTRHTRVRMEADTPLAGQRISAELGMGVTGTITHLSVSYEPQVVRNTAMQTTLSFVRAGVYAVLVIVFIVLFFRRMVARLIDFRSAGIDALVMGIAFGSIFLLSRQGMFEGLDWPVWAMILLRVVVFSFVGIFTSLFVFVLSGVTDSFARDRFPTKIRTLMLLRHGQLHNASTGSGLLRGILTGGVLLGVMTLMFWLMDGSLPKVTDFMLSDALYRPIVGDVAGGFAATYMNTFLLCMSFGMVAYGTSGKGWIVIPVVALGTVLLQLAPASVVMTWEGVLIQAAAGVLLGLAFLKWDLFTVLMALFSSTLLWSQKQGLLVAGADSWIDSLIAILLLISLLIFAILGIVAGEEERSVKEYVPEYVAEMASQERLKSELEIAYQVQASFLPRSMPRIKSLDLAGMCLPANEVGGDYYDFIDLDEQHLAVVIGDVSGKGIHASFFMTLVKGILQSASQMSSSPAEVLRHLNHLFYINVPSGTFITLIYGVLDIQTGKFTFVRAGHNPAILLRAESSEFAFLQPAGMAVGFVDRGLFDKGIKEETVFLQPGDMIVLYTDGFSEAMNTKRELYGDERLAAKAAHVGCARSASAMLRMLTEDVYHFIEGMGRADDMTMMVIKRRPEA